MLILMVAVGCGVSWAEEEPAAVSDQSPETSAPTLSDKQQELYKEMQIWYGKSLEMGEKGKEWIMEDIQNIGDWEYQIVTLSPDDEEKLAEQLNRLGKARWEVFWVQEKMHGIRFYLKRPVRTYLKHIPVSDLLHVIPKGEGE